MVDRQYLDGNKVAVVFKKRGEEKTYFAKGRVGQSLIWLLHKGRDGVTAQEISSWALRLGAYVFLLRHDYNLNIITIREPHDGGYHARYVLKDDVEIVRFIPSL